MNKIPKKRDVIKRFSKPLAKDPVKKAMISKIAPVFSKCVPL